MQITLDDAWLISVKNRIREYIVAVNSIFLLPAAQQEPTKEYAERVDVFIRDRLFPILREMAAARRIEIDEEGYAGHALVYRGKYPFLDYLYFKNGSSKQEYYINLSPITTIPANAVIPTLIQAAKNLEDLTHCRPKDVIARRLTHYLHIERLMSLICRSKIDIEDDLEQGVFSCSIETKKHPYLYAVVAKIIAENYHFIDVYDTPNGIHTSGSTVQPVINIRLATLQVSSECGYGTKSEDGIYRAIIPYKGEIICDGYLFEFPISKADSEEFSDRFNRVIYPEHKRFTSC